MENVSRILIDLILVIILGAAGLVMLIATIVGVPYIAGKVLLRIKILPVILGDTDPDPWIIGMGSLFVGGAVLTFGVWIKALLGL